MKLFRVHFELAYDDLSFEDELLLPAESIGQARTLFEEIVLRAPGLIVPRPSGRMLFPLQHAKSRVFNPVFTQISSRKDSKRKR